MFARRRSVVTVGTRQAGDPRGTQLTAGAATAHRRASAASTGADGIRNPDRGWTVFELPSTLGSFLYVRSSMCGPDRAGGGQDWVVVIICQAAAAARELDAAAHRRHGGGRTPRSAAPLERGGPRPRDHRRRKRGSSSPLPWRTALAARTSSSPSPAVVLVVTRVAEKYRGTGRDVGHSRY